MDKMKQFSTATAKTKTARASVTFPAELYDALARIAEQKKVSVAWVVRDAVEKYMEDQWPLFAGESRKHTAT